jgi:Notch 1
VAGTQTCTFGAFGVCNGQVTPVVDKCGDGLDTDCDGLNDTAEGCVTNSGTELRLDSTAVAGATEGSAAGAFHSYDVTIASGGNPLGTNVYAAWVDKRNGNADIFFSRSTDGGATWSAVTNLCSGTTNQCVAPRVVAAFDATLGADRVYVAFQRFGTGAAGVRALFFVRSSNSGSTFAAEQRMDTGANDNFHHDLAVNADGTRVVIAWEELDTATLARRVLSRASTNSGATMAAQRVVNVGSGANPIAGRPVAAVTTSGRFVFVWRERRATVTQNVYANFADDTTSALAVGNERRLDNDTADNRDADRPQLARVGQNLYVVWEDISTLSGGGSDAMFSRSTNNGVTWTVEAIIDDPSAEVSSSFAPVIAVDAKTASTTDDAIYVAWEDSRDGSQVYASRSLDSGATFGAPIRASSDAGAAVGGTTDEVQIAFLGSSTVAISYQNDAGAGGNPHVYVAASIDEGATWQVDDPVIDAGAGPATAPRIAPARGTLTVGATVIWNDFRTAPGINGDIFRRRYGR